MRFLFIVIILFSQIYIKAIADTESKIDFTPLYYNILDLNKEQISQFKDGNESKLDTRQKAQYRILKHLERKDAKRSMKKKDYYKSNPRMSVFGDLNKK